MATNYAVHHSTTETAPTSHPVHQTDETDFHSSYTNGHKVAAANMIHYMWWRVMVSKDVPPDHAWTRRTNGWSCDINVVLARCRVPKLKMVRVIVFTPTPCSQINTLNWWTRDEVWLLYVGAWNMEYIITISGYYHNKCIITEIQSSFHNWLCLAILKCRI